MENRDLIRAISRLTGESVDRVQRMGFSLVIIPKRNHRRKCRHRCPVPSGTRSLSLPGAAVR